MDFILSRHPCTIVFAAWIIGIPTRLSGTILNEPIMYFMGDGLFVAGLITGIVLIVRGRRLPPRASVYCHVCGKPCAAESELTEHALSHR